MNNLQINVVNKVATYQKRDGTIVCGNSDYRILFTFDSEWESYAEKTARFIVNGTFTDVDFKGNTCPVPIIRNTSQIEVGVYAGNLTTTTSAIIPARLSVLCGGEAPTPENDKNYANEAKESAERAEEAATKTEELLAEYIDEVAAGARYKNGTGEIFNDYAGNIASGANSHAEGSGTKASGNSAHSEGRFTKAEGFASHAEGNYTHAGANAVIFSDTSKLDYSTKGVGAHAEGQATAASGNSSHAEGWKTTASGQYSHAEGNNTTASGMYSHAGGVATIASGEAQMVIGKYNLANTNTLFVVGNGTANSNRKNAFEVLTNGDVRISGITLTKETIQKVVDFVNTLS